MTPQAMADLDVAWRQLFGQRFGQSVHAGFGCRVGSFTGSADSSPHGGNVDDLSLLLGNHVADGAAAAVKNGRKIGI